jgi:uncharacterized protein YneF (UPF0154 family)
MSDDGGKEQSDKNVLHLDEAERLPAVQNTSPAAEVVKQIIEQILANERRRARMEFIRISVFFLVFLFVLLGSGIWFARQLLAQLREERQLTEQTWRMMAGGAGGGNAVMPLDEPVMKTPPALNREEIAGLEKNINAASDLLKSKPSDSSASIREMLQHQQDAIQSLNAQLNEAKNNTAGASPASEEPKKVDFISAPVAEDTNLRMPIP